MTDKGSLSLETNEAKSSFVVRRGLKVEVETIEPAEFDLLLNNAGTAFIERIAKELTQLPFSRDDEVEPPARVRAFDEYDVCFIVSRAESVIVVTIVRVWPTSERERMRQLLKGVDMLAMLRGAAGI